MRELIPFLSQNKCGSVTITLYNASDFTNLCVREWSWGRVCIDMLALCTLSGSADENALIPVLTGRTVGGTVLLVTHAYIRGDRDREEK
jgi:hypothetical protein